MKQFPTHIVAVSGIIENELGQVLLIKHRNGRWGWPGGQVETGENLIEALEREIMEESGVRAEVLDLFAVKSNTAGYPGYGGYEYVPTKVMFDFRCRYIGGELLCETDETTDAEWVDKREAVSRFDSPFREAYEAFLSYDGRPRYFSYVSRPEYHLHVDRRI